jgi:RNA polymerase sigma-70 factor (ECF subfamily)
MHSKSKILESENFLATSAHHIRKMANLLALTQALAHRIALSSNERELLLRARTGEREAVAILLHRHRTPIFRLCFQILRDSDAAEDAAQEVLLRGFEKMPGFRGESEFSSWLYRIALNHCLEVKRTLARREALQPESPTCHSVDFSGRVDTRLAMENALDALPESLRVVLILRQWHEKSYDEIATILSLPLGTVKTRLHQARGQFRQIWETQNGD